MSRPTWFKTARPNRLPDASDACILATCRSRSRPRPSLWAWLCCPMEPCGANGWRRCPGAPASGAGDGSTGHEPRLSNMSNFFTYISCTHSRTTIPTNLMGYDFFCGVFSERPQKLCHVFLHVLQDIFSTNLVSAGAYRSNAVYLKGI